MTTTTSSPIPSLAGPRFGLSRTTWPQVMLGAVIAIMAVICAFSTYVFLRRVDASLLHYAGMDSSGSRALVVLPADSRPANAHGRGRFDLEKGKAVNLKIDPVLPSAPAVVGTAAAAGAEAPRDAL